MESSLQQNASTTGGHCFLAWIHDGSMKQFSHHSSYAVISRSNDGELLSTLLKKWGFSLLRGSSARGGSEILADMVEVSKKHYLLITPDGPQGPAYNFKAGAVIAAQRSGSPLYLCSIKSTQALYFRKSWILSVFRYHSVA